MVYLASHGSRRHVLEVDAAAARARAAHGARAARAARRRRHQVADRRRVRVLFRRLHRSAQGRQHARADGLGGRSRVVRLRPAERRTFFGEALFQHGLAQSDSLLAAFDAAKERVAAREKEGGFTPPSNPQIFVGPAMADKLKELDRGNARAATGRSV